MKKWVVFFSVTCAICVIIIAFQIERFRELYTYYKHWIKPEFESTIVPGHYNKFLLENSIYPMIKTSISIFLLSCLFIFSAVMLISVILHKIQPFSVRQNLSQWKATRKQRKLEKAQAKVAQLQNDIQKDDE